MTLTVDEEKLSRIKEKIDEKNLEISIEKDKYNKAEKIFKKKQSELYMLQQQQREVEAKDEYLLKKETFEFRFRQLFEQVILNKMLQTDVIKNWEGLANPRELEYYIAFRQYEVRPRHGKISVKIEWLNGDEGFKKEEEKILK